MEKLHCPNCHSPLGEGKAGSQVFCQQCNQSVVARAGEGLPQEIAEKATKAAKKAEGSLAKVERKVTKVFKRD